MKSPPSVAAALPEPRKVIGPPAGRRRLRTFDSLHLAGYRWFWIGLIASFTAVHMQEVARGWLVYELTRSPLALGLVSAAGGISLLIAAPIGGVMADRVDKRKLLFVAQSALVLVTLPIAILITLDKVQLWHLIAAGVVSSAIFAFIMPSRQALLPELVGKENLGNAVALNSAATNLTIFLGPALAGIVVDVAGVDMAYYITGVAYLAVVVTLFKVPPAKASGPNGNSVWKDMGEGVRYLRGNRLVMLVLLATFVPLFFGMAYRFLLPAFVVDVLGREATALGLLVTATGVGALIGSLTMASLREQSQKGKLLLAATFSFGIGLILFSFTSNYVLALFFMLAVGTSSSSFMTLSNTLVQSEISDEVRGRVMSIYMLGFGVQSISVLPIAALAEWVGVGWAIAAGGGLLIAFTVVMAARFPQLRRI